MPVEPRTTHGEEAPARERRSSDRHRPAQRGEIAVPLTEKTAGTVWNASLRPE